MLVVAMVGGVQLAGFSRMMGRVQMMAMGQMRVMRGRLMVAIVVMVGGVIVMGGGLRMKFRSLAMMLDDMLGMRHDTLQPSGRDVRVGERALRR
jgi:hypothetical protein